MACHVEDEAYHWQTTDVQLNKCRCPFLRRVARVKLSQDEVACNNASFNCFCVASTQTSRDGSFEASVTSLGRHDDIDTEPTQDSKTGRLSDSLKRFSLKILFFTF